MNRPTVTIAVPKDRLAAMLLALDNAEQLAAGTASGASAEVTLDGIRELHGLLDAARFRRPTPEASS